MEQILKRQELCPIKDQACPLADELERLKEECKRLIEISQLDSLTGFFNFHHLLTALGEEMERVRRTGLYTSLVMIDLDHFKRVNDTYGHESGNKALKWATKIWRENIRRIDIPCRYGGEEFAIILPGIGLPQAVRTAERLRALLANSPVRLKNRKVRLRASFGVNAYKGIENLSVEAFIERTDEFLLRAKRKGRDCVCYDEGEMVKTPTEITDEEREELFKIYRSSEKEKEG